jgi:hypothetical protein
VNISKATIVAHFRYCPDFIAGDNCLGKQKATLSSWYIQPGQTGAYGGPTVATAEMNKLILDAVVASDVLFSRSIGRIENRHSRFPTREGVFHREGFRREDEPCLRETAHA